MRDVLVRALRVGLVNTSDLDVGHRLVPSPLLDQLGERTTCALAQCVQAHVSANTGRKIRSVGFPQRPDERVPALLADFTIEIPTALIQPDVTLLSVL